MKNTDPKGKIRVFILGTNEKNFLSESSISLRESKTIRSATKKIHPKIPPVSDAVVAVVAVVAMVVVVVVIITFSISMG